MSSKKYVLNTDGRIILTSVEEDGSSVTSSISAETATDNQLRGFENFESVRTNFGLVKASSVIGLPFGPLNDGTRGSITQDKEGLLHSTAYGGIKGENKYYNNFNSIFVENENERKIYAEELEILAGFDANSIGVASLQGIDLVKYTFLLDYVFETSLYIVVAESIIRNLEGGNNVLYNYFHNILNYPKFNLSDKVEPLAYFLIGLNEFINTDPKIQDLIKNKLVQKANLNILDIDYQSPNAIWTNLLNNLLDNLLGLSKLEHNRILLLIRKFHQESYWHTDILYRAKQDSAENFIDKSFVEFSQYYFKFVIERMHIGRMIWRRKVLKELNKKTLISQRNRLSEDRHKLSKNKVIRSEENKNKKSSDGRFTGDYSSRYMWQQALSRDAGNNTLSVTALPQLLKTNTYIKKVVLQNAKLRQNFDDSDETENTQQPQKRLSPEVVRKVEEYLNSEYMPFYFHDLRTNEIISFHAFIDTISDSFSPEYTSSSGYGRIDDVKHYVKTTRTINTTFSIVSYNQDDHDLMWYQINKLVSMVYPQWSKGILNKNRQAYPFTQMPTASPLIRLRIGDVITSNYSKENLARLHVHGGKIGRQKVSKTESSEKTTPIKSPSRRKSQYTTPLKIQNNFLIKTNDSKYAFPVYENQIFNRSYGSSNRENKNFVFSKNPISKKEYENLSIEQKKMFVIPSLVEKDSIVNEYEGESFVAIIKRSGMSESLEDISSINFEEAISKFEIVYNTDEFGQKLSKEYFINKEDIFDITSEEYKNVAGKKYVNARTETGIMNNPFTAAYESSRGEGLAGFITNLDVNYNDMVWQTEIKGSRAPMMVKITIAFAPVHDIPMGLDHLGEMRAPAYNVGSLNRQIFRTPYDDIDN